jgi:hypothetical protein
MKRKEFVVSGLRSAFLLATLLATAPALRACGLENPSSVNIGGLNLAYPDSLHVRTAVWVAQRDGVLAPYDAVAVTEPQAPPLLLQQMAHFREIQRQFTVLKAGMDDGEGHGAPSFSVVLLGIVLWTRFEPDGAGFNMTVHAPGPGRDDVVIVTDAPVIAALADGRLAPDEARRHGLMRSYGAPQDVRQVERIFGRIALGKGATQEEPASSSRGGKH